ncbi:MAG: hypothetical protein ACFFFH_10450 [Candidatus Thorarchaeota archaeon]
MAKTDETQTDIWNPSKNLSLRRSRVIKFGYIKVNSVLTQTPPLVSREVPSDN